MSLTRSPATPVVDFFPTLDSGGDLDERRRQALAAALTEATGAATAADPDSWAPSIRGHRYGEGCLALALAGTFDRVGVERVHALALELDVLAAVELSVDLSELRDCTPALARALGRLRIRRLTAGARVELYSPPRELAAEMGQLPLPR